LFPALQVKLTPRLLTDTRLRLPPSNLMPASIHHLLVCWQSITLFNCENKSLKKLTAEFSLSSWFVNLCVSSEMQLVTVLLKASLADILLYVLSVSLQVYSEAVRGGCPNSSSTLCQPLHKVTLFLCFEFQISHPASQSQMHLLSQSHATLPSPPLTPRYDCAPRDMSCALLPRALF
jgi:hypothetical protein